MAAEAAIGHGQHYTNNKQSKMKETGAAPKSPLVTAWLVLYNLFAICGWFYIDFLLYQHYAASGALYGASLWRAMALPVKIMQTAALLEVAHAALRLVPSNPAMAFIQGAPAPPLLCLRRRNQCRAKGPCFTFPPHNPLATCFPPCARSRRAPRRAVGHH